MENENNFKETVSSLFKGMDGFVAAKTVVGDAIHVGDTIILPLVDVSFGVGAGSFRRREEEQRRRRSRRKNDSMCRAGDPEWNHQACQRKESGWTDQSSGYGSGFCKPLRTWRK